MSGQRGGALPLRHAVYRVWRFALACVAGVLQRIVVRVRVRVRGVDA